MALRVRRTFAGCGEPGDLRGGVPPRRWAGARQRRRREADGPHADEARNRRAARALAAADPVGGRRVVAGVQRAGGGKRSRQRADEGFARGRRVDRRRPEDLYVVRRVRRLDLRAGADRSERRAASRALLRGGRHALSRCRSSAHRSIGRSRWVRRSFLHRSARARLADDRRGERRVVGRLVDARVRT